MIKNKYIFAVISTIITLNFTACTSPSKSLDKPKYKKIAYQKPTAQKYAAFKNTMVEVAKSTQYDSRYNKMQLDTPEKKAWFKNLMFKLWDRRITRDDFILEGLSYYPNHIYEFRFVANGFQKKS